MKHLFVSMFLLSLCVACEKESSYEKASYEQRQMSRAVFNVELPTGLWDLMEKSFHGGAAPAAGGGHGSGAEAEEAEASLETPTQFVGLRVYFLEKTPGILGGRNHEFIFNKGGGELDLADIVVPEINGSFYVAAKPDMDRGENPQMVYYLSNAKRRRIGGEVFGDGCNVYFDLSKAWQKVMSQTGLLVNTTQARHVSVLAGSYFFVIPMDGRMNLTQLTIKDSSKRGLLCRRG